MGQSVCAKLTTKQSFFPWARSSDMTALTTLSNTTGHTGITCMILVPEYDS